MKNRKYYVFFIAVLYSCVLAFDASAKGDDNLAAVQEILIRNMTNPSANIYSSGQPTRAQFDLLAKAGVKHIVNLRPVAEQNWDEAEYVNTLGITYHHIPVKGAQGITKGNAILLKDALEKIKSEPVLVHCGSGNRVGALVALEQGMSTGNIEESISAGKAWGLTSLESRVKALLVNK